MGKPTGFLEYKRQENPALSVKKRVKSFEEFHTALDLERRREQGARCMNCGVPFCQSHMVYDGVMSGCPLANLIPEWNDELYKGNYDEALSRLLKTNNFPEFTSRVCPALCENGCTCGIGDEAVTVRENEYAIIEKAFADGKIKPCPPKVRSGKRVAVIGSGPSGLAAADRLNKRGHSVTVFEKADRPGGLLMYGIPNMKLDKSVVLRRTDIMRAEGVKFKLSCEVGKDISAEKIYNEFDAVVLCCGSEVPRDLGYDKSVEGVIFAVDFLRSATKALLDGKRNRLSAKNKDVVIIGAGDTSNDCLATALRQGARSVYRVDIKSEPVYKKTLWGSLPFPDSYACEEAREVYGKCDDDFCTMIESIGAKNGKLDTVTTVKVEFKDGKLIQIPGTQKIRNADMLITASGFISCDESLCEQFSLGTLKGRAQTQSGKVFSAGDMRIGQSLVVKAIAEGRAAAQRADKFLIGYTNMLK